MRLQKVVRATLKFRRSNSAWLGAGKHTSITSLAQHYFTEYLTETRSDLNCASVRSAILLSNSVLSAPPRKLFGL